MKYEENNDEQKGNAEFYVFIREFKEEELVIKPIAAKPQVSQAEVVGSFENEQNSTGGSGAAFISANNTEYASNVSSEGNLIALFKKHGGTVETVEIGSSCVNKGIISFGDKGNLYLYINAFENYIGERVKDGFYYSATSQESDKEFIEEFDSEKLNPQKVVRQGSEWYEKERSWSFVRDGIDYVVDEEYFEEIIQKCTKNVQRMIFKGENWLLLAEASYPYIYSTEDPGHKPWTGAFSAGVDLTFGLGHSIKTEKEFQELKKFIGSHSQKEVEDKVKTVLQEDLSEAVTAVNDFIEANDVILKQHEFDAIVSLVFNQPAAISEGSDLTKALVNEDFAKGTLPEDIIETAFMYTRYEDKRIDGLVTRRNNELNLFFYGNYNVYYDTKEQIIKNRKSRIPYPE